jgi:hypothetical protein
MVVVMKSSATSMTPGTEAELVQVNGSFKDLDDEPLTGV